MGQMISCCTLCCPCPLRRKGNAAAVTGAAEEKLLPPSSSKRHKSPGKKKTSKYRRPPSHLRELSGDINQVVRLVLVGGCDTGKTCLLRRFLGGYFDEAGQQGYTRTLGVDFGCKTVELTDRRVRLQMWDTGGSETYRNVVSHYLRGADGVILCFDVNRKTTLRKLRSTWAPFLDKHMPRTCRVLLAGNKADCGGDSRVGDAGVFDEEAKRFADAIEAQMFETSAKLGTNVDTAVMALMREVLHHREFPAQNKGDVVQESASPKRRGRRRLSVSLRDVPLGCGGEGESASSCVSSDGKGRGSPQANSFDGTDGTLTEGTTSSAGSSAASRGNGDSSGPENNECKKRENHHQSWGPLLRTSGGDADEVSALGNSVGDGRSEAGILDGVVGSAKKDGEPDLGRTGRVGRGDDTKRGGRYHLVNQLAISSPSRGPSFDAAGKGLNHGGTGNQSSDRGSTSERSGRNGRSRRRRASSRTLSPIPNLGSVGRPAASSSPRRPVAASQSDAPPRVAVGPTVVIDERQLRAGGSLAVTGVETPVSACAGGGNEASAAKAREASPPSRSPVVAPSAPSLGAPTAERKSPGRSGRLTSTPMSASSSFSTVLAENDRARYRFSPPN